jgi:hypothetical protein
LNFGHVSGMVRSATVLFDANEIAGAI